MDIEKHIISAPLFSGLETGHIKNLARISLCRKFRRGELIFSEGDDASGFFIMISGRVKIYKISPEGKEQILHIFGGGEPFGEVPVFTGQPFPACSEALTEMSTLFFPRDAFIDLLRDQPSLALNMLSVLSLRLKRFTVLIENLSLKEVPARLAAYFIYLSERSEKPDEFCLDVPKVQLASILGTIPETLSRILSRFVKEGLVESEGRKIIRITNRADIEKLAKGEMRLA